jgi:hypothetical protein
MAGAIAMGYLVGGLFFLRFWRDLRDRLFLLFGLAFLLLCAQRVALAATDGSPEAQLPIYGLRLLAFVVIIVAILDKNREARG